jgi:hypothetical protein
LKTIDMADESLPWLFPACFTGLVVSLGWYVWHSVERVSSYDQHRIDTAVYKLKSYLEPLREAHEAALAGSGSVDPLIGCCSRLYQSCDGPESAQRFHAVLNRRCADLFVDSFPWWCVVQTGYNSCDNSYLHTILALPVETRRLVSIEPEIGSLDRTKDTPTEEVDLRCTVCMNHIRAVVLVPCGHYKLCRGCAVDIHDSGAGMKCPQCRADVQQVVEVFA